MTDKMQGDGAGWVAVVGVGPGADDLVTPAVRSVVDEATDVVGYGRYVARVAPRAGLERHASDNGDELARARRALALAQSGHKVVVVSSGDPGVFAMAAAVFEVIESDPARFRTVDVRVLPGVTAMLAAAARAGAPLGHDFCVLNLSCNLKPWSVLERRLEAAVHADFAMALYNPRSRSRPDDLDRVLDLVRGRVQPDRVVIFARAVSTPEESLRVVTIADARGDMADMRTLVIIGSSHTRTIDRPGAVPFVYSPRSVAP